MRWVARSIVALVGVLLVAAAVGYLWIRGSLPDLVGTVSAVGISAPVEIIRDRHGVPHVVAMSRDDALYGLGYVHAQDRLWQMEVNRRIGAGRLSEVLGRYTLPLDRTMRVLGFNRSARQNLANSDPSTRRALESYTAGVNAFIASRDLLGRPLPPEFIVLGVNPEPWKPEDSLVSGKMIAFELSVNMREELLRAHLAQTLDPQQLADIYPAYPHPDAHELGELSDLYASIPWGAAWRALAQRSDRENGSNNWVVPGSHSATGKPILANDPHLRLSVPSVWYLAHLEAPGLNAIGATMPAMPSVVLGRNDRVAWGFTNTYGDVQDVFIERMVDGDPDRYMSPDGPRRFELHEEVIRVRNEKPVHLAVRATRHGPVISDLMTDEQRAQLGNTVLSLAYTALDENDLTFRALLGIQKARNWEEFSAALRDYAAPQQNMVYADVDGNVGLIAPAWVPQRDPANKLQGAFPSLGWDALYDWKGFVPFDELPQRLNPADGLIATANDSIVDSDYPHHITFDWEAPYRIRRIRELIAADTTHSMERSRRVHGDGVSTMARDFLPFLVQADPLSAESSRAIALLSRWDGDMDADRPEPLIFSYWYSRLESQIYADEFGPVFEEAWRFRPRFIWNVLNSRQAWCDDIASEEVETCDHIVARALERTVRDLAEAYGDDMSRWRWGEAHYAQLRHLPFTYVPVLNKIFDRRIASSGGPFTVNRGRYDISDDQAPFRQTHGSTFRAIYDLSDLDRSLYIQIPGQSGNPLSLYYDNFVQTWRDTEYIPMTTARRDYAAGARRTLILSPAQ